VLYLGRERVNRVARMRATRAASVVVIDHHPRLISGDARPPPCDASPGDHHLLHKPVRVEAFRAVRIDVCVQQR
jgi:hypothetical protein